jgi:hypothetical protein
MRLQKGKNRIVIIFPFFHIALKFPIIHFSIVTRLLYIDIKNGDWKSMLKQWRWSVDVNQGFKGLLFGGFAANWYEFLFYWQTRNPFIQPTYFSLFGLFSIQRVDEPCLMKFQDLFYQLCDITDDLASDDSHHFINVRNFCFHNGKLRMADYGSRKSREVITKYGKKITESFNPAYCWEEEKRRR